MPDTKRPREPNREPFWMLSMAACWLWCWMMSLEFDCMFGPSSCQIIPHEWQWDHPGAYRVCITVAHGLQAATWKLSRFADRFLLDAIYSDVALAAVPAGEQGREG